MWKGKIVLTIGILNFFMTNDVLTLLTSLMAVWNIAKSSLVFLFDAYLVCGTL